jgi:putative tryptophan/tyrosine transport system substrate-binding protein
LLAGNDQLVSQFAERREADLVDKILRGTKSGDIPVEQPIKFDFIINLTAAKALG